jgi:hypothetical protein
VFSFNLNDTSQLLPALLRCAQANANPQPVINSSASAMNPFVAYSGPSGSAQFAGSNRASHRAEAVSLAANVLGSAGITGFRIFDEGQVSSRFDAAWAAGPNLGGMVSVFPDKTPEIISASAIAYDAAGCKFRFASGSIPASPKDRVPRLFTKCGDGKEAFTVYYVILPRKAGGHYLVGIASVGSEEPARKAESDIRQAAFTALGQ